MAVTSEVSERGGTCWLIMHCPALFVGQQSSIQLLETRSGAGSDSRECPLPRSSDHIFKYFAGSLRKVPLTPPAVLDCSLQDQGESSVFFPLLFWLEYRVIKLWLGAGSE